MKKEKYLQIFNYLLEFSKLRTNPVRDIQGSDIQYPEVLWFADIPQYDIFDSITFPYYDKESDYWLKIKKPKDEPSQPTFPKISKLLTEWIVKDSLLDENGTPLLKDKIEQNGKEIFSAEKPEVEAEFKTYLNDKWIDDLEFYKKEFEIYKANLADYEKQNKIYKRLFSIYNKAQQFGEEYELIVGIGLLNFRENPDTPLICRHILTSKAEISWQSSAKESFIKVSPSIDNEIQIENDAIIDLSEQFESANIIAAEKEVAEYLKKENIIESPFDNKIKEEAIQKFTRVRVDVHVKDDLVKPREIPSRPTIYFAPALILRKRNTRSLTAVYENIIKNINDSEDSININSINDIIGHEHIQEDFICDSNNESPTSLDDETIYFPQKYNDEQIDIIHKIRRDNKVLVQGPPGTGKSHTIANLICHLLANGNKVLVTAYTKTALEVLKDKIPDDFQNLCVNLLSDESESFKSLNTSINTINAELSKTTNIDRYKKEIEEKKTKLSLTKEKKAYTENELVKIKEKSTRQQNINKNYQGTLLEIAEKIEKDNSVYVWLKDEFTDINNISIIADIENFDSLTKYYQSIDCTTFNFIVPQKENLLPLGELTEYLDISNELVRKYSSKKNCVTINCKDYVELKKLLQELNKYFLEIENDILPFKQKLVSDYRNNFSFWEDKIKRTEIMLSELSLEKLRHLDRTIHIQYPKNKNLIELKSDAEFLLKLMKEGKKLRGIFSVFNNPLAPSHIKQRQYFIQSVQVNGNDCDTQKEFADVLEDIKIKQDFQELEYIWESKPSETIKYSFDKAKFYKQRSEDTETLINLLRKANAIKVQIETFSSIRIQNYDSAQVKELIDEINYNDLLSRVIILKEKILETNRQLSIQNIHPIATGIKETIANIDTDKYEQLLSEIDALNLAKRKYEDYIELKVSIEKYFPILVKDILENTFDSSNYKKIENAIYFKHARAEITKILEEGYEQILTNRISDLEHQEVDLITEIGCKKAWGFVFESLEKNPELKKHLNAFALFAEKGKGRGKRAMKFRKDIQEQMQKCKKSVPCWIMPLYKVAETVIPEQEMYDYVIIDEASQLGPDAIFLMYISKKIIIVGDEKQISPEDVGIDANKMTPYIEKYLKEFQFKNCFQPDFSFFGFSQVFCNGMTVLREHFRCMPEIIEFSNRYFYAPDGKGLYPLKQYSENRMEPLKTVYCQNGYVEGNYQDIINKVEQEALVNKIAELIKDDNYKGKSFGVIALQGKKQAEQIDKLIISKIGDVKYKERNIKCGISSKFQGDERDIMFLSLITASNHRRAPLVKAEDERRFNVAVSRAKEQVWLFHSVQLEDLSNPNDLRYKLLNHFINYKENRLIYYDKIERRLGTQPSPFGSWFEVDVYNDIVSNGHGVIPQYEVVKARRFIDLVPVLSNGTKIAVECDGDKFHGAEQFLNDTKRQKQLERCGWQFFRVRGSEYYLNRKKALEPLWKLLKDNNNQKDELADVNTSKQSYEEQDKNETSEINIKETKTQKHSEKIKNVQEGLFDKSFKMENPSKIDSISNKSVPITSPQDSIFSDVLVFTSAFNVYKVQKKNISDRLSIIENIDFEAGEKSIYITGTNDYSGYLIVAFENGKVAKIPVKSYQTEYNRKKLKNAFNDESELIFIEHIENDIDLVAVSSIEKIVLFNTAQINPVDSRTTKGVQVMKTKFASKMIKVKKLNQVKLSNPEYYRKNELNVVGYYLKSRDKI
jgi:hypothetical protein